MPSPPGPRPGEQARLLFPIGVLAGTFPDQDGGHHHQVRRGGRVHELSDAELAAWAFAHGPPGTATELPTRSTRSAVAQRVRASGVDGAGQLIDDLLGRGLLVEAPVDGDRAVGFARAHRPVPTMYGLGNSPEQPGQYSIGLLGQEVIQVGWPVFELWAWAHLDGSLWRGCQTFAEQERAAGGADPAVGDAARVLAGFLGALHSLLGAQAVYLDPAPEPAGETALDPAGEQ